MISDKVLQEIAENGYIITDKQLIREMVSEVLAHRKKDSWDDAPEWARWRAMDGDGAVWYYENRPTWDISRDEWVPNGKYKLGWNTHYAPQNSLEERPE